MSRKRKASKNKTSEILKQKEVLVMLVEGETEERYISYLKDIFSFKIKIVVTKKSTLGSDISSTIRKLASYHNIDEDELVLVYDLENSAEEYKKFIQGGKLIHEKTFLTQPAIEFHFLLHFEEPSNKFYAVTDCEQKLKTFLPQYKKGKDFDWAKNGVSKEHVITSMERANKSFRSHKQQSFSRIGALIRRFFYTPGTV